MAGDRGGSTNPADINTIKFNQVNKGNTPGRGGATNSSEIKMGPPTGPSGSTNRNTKTEVGAKQPAS